MRTHFARCLRRSLQFCSRSFGIRHRRRFAAEEVDLLLVLAADVSRSVDQPKFQLAARRLCRGDFQSARARRDRLRAEPPHRDLLRGMVGLRQPEARDRLDDRCRMPIRRAPSATSSSKRRAPSPTAPRSAAALEFSMAQFDARALFCQAPHHRRVGRRHQQFRPRRRHGARRGRGTGRHHQRSRDPERTAAAVESGTHQPARRIAEIFRGQCDRRSRLVRDRGGGFQILRRRR